MLIWQFFRFFRFINFLGWPFGKFKTQKSLSKINWTLRHCLALKGWNKKMSQSPTVPCQQIKHLDNSSPIADLVSFGSVTRRSGQYSEVNSSIHLYVVLGAIHKLWCNFFSRNLWFVLIWSTFFVTKNDLQHFEKKIVNSNISYK